jgi:hypothetical protein
MDFISIVGPVKTIQSDNGSELVNKVIDKMLNSLGIDRRVSSSYSPHVQGSVEGLNKVLASCLRKCAESNKNDFNHSGRFDIKV